ncbi:MAG: thiosulfate oxidation carrier protein SoxY [Rhodobiaceae bacterium]|nr:thiosulfate oxidation carrier protein SoxY [Rhodobiaceae bacterium]MCC0053877.1 thiosulfate oxidation carrier protein SoxY [Rhodobiaceae bacterium]
MSANVTRRTALALGAAAFAAGFAGLKATPALSAEIDDIIKEFTGGKEPEMGRVAIDAPEIAENGNTVPVGINVDSPMTADDHVASVLILAAGNPRPGVATFHFSPLSGAATAQTRMRLAKTQDIVAIAKMSNGSLFMDKRTVKVTIGGCGG